MSPIRILGREYTRAKIGDMPRSNDISVLHAVFREPAEELIRRCEANGLQIQVYEAGRSPFRQAEIYARGRVQGAPDFGKKVTNARAWESFHCHFLAIDGVFNVGGRWTWDEPRPGDWKLYTKLCAEVGLRTLSFEKPHAELPVSLADLRAGRYPAGGGDAWLEALETAIEQWGRSPRVVSGFEHPGAPPLPSISERPALVLPDGLPPSPFA